MPVAKTRRGTTRIRPLPDPTASRRRRDPVSANARPNRGRVSTKFPHEPTGNSPVGPNRGRAAGGRIAFVNHCWKRFSAAAGRMTADPSAEIHCPRPNENDCTMVQFSQQALGVQEVEDGSALLEKG